MKRDRGRMGVGTAAAAALLWALLAVQVLAADAPPPGEQPAAEQPAAGEEAPAAAPAEEKGKAEEGKAAENEKDKKIPLNLKGASIDNVIDFIRTNTGKTVVKAKDVQAQITIATAEPVTPQAAVKLILDALRMEGIAVVETDDTIQLMPAKKLSEMGSETRTIPVRFADATQIQTLLTPMLGEGVKMVADPRSHQILITGPPERLAELEKVVAQLDVLEVMGTQVQIFQLQFADADEVASVVEAVLRQGMPGKPSGGPPRPGGAQPAAGGELTVVPYPAANWVVVRAPREVLEAAAELIKQLDREKPPELDLNVIPVKHGDATQMAARLSELFRRRPRSKSPSDLVEVTADLRSNALIVMSTAENFQMVRKIVAELDTAESRKTETRTYELTYADAEDVAQQLNDLYTGMNNQSYNPFVYVFGYSSRSGNQNQVQFVAQRRTNSLLVIAPPAEFEQIESLLKQLDQPLNKTEVSPHIYHVRNIDAKELSDVLNDIFGVEGQGASSSGYYYYMMRSPQRAQDVGRLYGKVRFVHEPATNSIIVITNNKENFPIIEDLIAELDRTTSEYANTMVYTLENADAQEVANQLNTLFAQPGAGRPASAADEVQANFYSWLMGSSRKEEERPISNLIGKVRVVADPRINALLITTSVQYFEVLRQLIKDLDEESPKVLVQVQLIEIVRSKEKRVGTRFASNSTIFEDKDFNSGFVSNFGVDWEDVCGDSVLSADIKVSVLMQFLLRNFDSSILSQPSMTVNNNREATLFVGSEVPFINQSQREAGTTARNDSYEYKDVGTTLKITPHINKNRKVVTTIEIVSSQIRPGEVVFGGLILDSRRFETELAVDDGQTIVIGGIMRTEEAETVHRVPVLGYIPILSLIFSKTDSQNIQTELIAFITPIVLTDRGSADDVTKKQREQLNELERWMRERNGGQDTMQKE